MNTFNIEALNGLDYAIIGILLLSIIISFFRGFVREVFSLVVWLIAFILALKFATPASAILPAAIHAETVRYVIMFAAIFLLVFVIGLVINLFIKTFVDKVGLGLADRGLGVCFGVVRGILAVTMILMFFSLGPMQNTQWYQSSQLLPLFNQPVAWAQHFIPEQVTHFNNWVGNSTRNHGRPHNHQRGYQ